MKNNLSFNIFLIIAAVALLINVGSYGVIESSDARYAEIGRAMYVSGDYIHPNLLDVHHYHKPPLTYQITALGYQIFGVNPLGARFFLQLAVLLQLILVYRLTILLFNNKKTALWASIIYFSFPLVLISSRNLTTDAFLATFALLSIYCWVKYRKTGFLKWLYFFTISLGLGFLTKGPVIFIVPVLFILFYNSTEKAKRNFSIHHVLAWTMFLAIASSWFVYLGLQNPAFIDYFLGKQTADRFSKNAFGRTEPFWYFLAFAPLVGLPWFLALLYLLKDQKKLFKLKTLHFALLIAVVIPLIFFSISSSKRILYILPLYSLLAILTARLFSKIETEKIKVINGIILGFSGLILIAFIVTPFVDFGLEFPYFLAILSGVILVLTMVIYRSKSVQLKSKPIFTSLLVALLLLISSSVIFAKNELEVNGTKPITDFIIEENLNDREILVYNTRKSSIAFGLNKSIISLYDGDESLNRETQFEVDLNWKKNLINLKDTNEFNQLHNITNKPTVLLLYKKQIPDSLLWLVKKYKIKQEIGKWTIYY
ncbi:glycosyltransferase family 39 protein [Aureibaculum sp. 2210JD6-5]|uniref:ArnT family glycosyltransferase n=1 Tax=Aureibaculum sp. 2210JD6-5 TaxID=3103957 RepID=UPI002AAD723D|nr:glycosyltransferase family 39 protein [Aureibaculum sp. 2210JD6-5]MDY7393672.1 glycosyltransferase family 39 protein [Aureibaculum sp. 2210JD6-5]